MSPAAFHSALVLASGITSPFLKVLTFRFLVVQVCVPITTSDDVGVQDTDVVDVVVLPEVVDDVVELFVEDVVVSVSSSSSFSHEVEKVNTNARRQSSNSVYFIVTFIRDYEYSSNLRITKYVV